MPTLAASDAVASRDGGAAFAGWTGICFGLAVEDERRARDR